MRVARLFGIDIYIDVSWLFVFVLVAWSLSVNLGPMSALSLSPVQRAVLGVVTALLFFASVLVHELAHSLVARRRGLPVSRITLFIFGGVSSISGEFDSAQGEGLVAFVGPLASGVLAVLFYAIAEVAGFRTVVGTAAGYLGFANALLAVFNLLPAYPLDGGKVLHSILWRRTGDQLRATRIAVAIGRAIAILMIVFGVGMFIFGYIGGLWFAFIGWFLYQAGGAEAFQTELMSTLRGRSAMDIATAAPAPVSPDDGVDAVMETLLHSGQRAIPVEQDSHLVGLITLSDLARIRGDGAARPLAGTVMTPLARLRTISPQASSVDALKALGESGYHQLPIIDADGKLLGFVTREGLMRRMALNKAGA